MRSNFVAPVLDGPLAGKEWIAMSKTTLRAEMVIGRPRQYQLDVEIEKLPRPNHYEVRAKWGGTIAMSAVCVRGKRNAFEMAEALGEAIHRVLERRNWWE